MENEEIISIVESFTMKETLESYDPYDIWKTKVGLFVKEKYYSNKILFVMPAALLTLFDIVCNNTFRIGYTKQEYPVVRAFASLCLINLYRITGRNGYIEHAKKHLDWLVKNSAPNILGFAWGIGFPLPISSGQTYPATTAFTTNTPYCLQAFHAYQTVTGTTEYNTILRGIYRFFMEDIQVLSQDENTIALSYSTFKDRIVINAQSYSLASISLLHSLFPDEYKDAKQRMVKLFHFIKQHQNTDGSWYYEPNTSSPFIDCFHSCFVLKNLFIAKQYHSFTDIDNVITKGYEYITSNFKDPSSGLYKRFTLSNKPSLITDDLYDNAEMIGLSTSINEIKEATSLVIAVKQHFHRNRDIYSQCDRFGILRNKNTLRWALMPYLYSLAQLAVRQHHA